jgi:protein TonB
MSNQNPSDNRTTTDQILDLLLDALVERQKARRGQAHAPQSDVNPKEKPDSIPPPRPEPQPADQARPAPQPARRPAPKP